MLWELWLLLLLLVVVVSALYFTPAALPPSVLSGPNYHCCFHPGLIGLQPLFERLIVVLPPERLAVCRSCYLLRGDVAGLLAISCRDEKVYLQAIPAPEDSRLHWRLLDEYAAEVMADLSISGCSADDERLWEILQQHALACNISVTRLRESG